MYQKGRSRANKQHGAIKLTDLSSWSSILPRSRGQTSYYDIQCTYKLGDLTKKDPNEVLSIESRGKRVIPQRNCWKNTNNAWMASLLLDLLPSSFKTFKSTQQSFNSSKNKHKRGLGALEREWGLAWGGGVA